MRTKDINISYSMHRLGDAMTSLYQTVNRVPVRAITVCCSRWHSHKHSAVVTSEFASRTSLANLDRGRSCGVLALLKGWKARTGVGHHLQKKRESGR